MDICAKEYFADTKAIDHNQYVKGNFVYQANLMSGLRILDISDIENPVEVGFFDTVPYDDDLTGFGGAWSNYPWRDRSVQLGRGIVLVEEAGEAGVIGGHG